MFKLFKNFTKREWTLIFTAIVFIVVQVWLDLTLPDYMSQITTLVQTPGSEMMEILQAGGKMLLCALGSLASSVIVAVMTAKVAANFAANLREKLYDKVQSFSLEEIGRFSTASLITRSTNDVQQVQMFITMGLQVIIKAPIMAIWAITKIAGKSYQWSLATGIAVVVLIVIIAICLIFAYPKFQKLQTLTDNLNRVTRENLTGLNVVRAYNGEAYQEEKFEQANQELTKTTLFANRVMAILSPGIQGIMSGLSLAIYWIGAIIINNAQMGEKLGLFSDMVVFSSYATQVVMAFMMMTIIFIMLPRASVSAKRINQVLDTKISIIDGEYDEDVNQVKGEIEFNNVSFRYPGAKEYVLKDISFKAHQGETIAIIGSTGSGKSTLINLVNRFYDVSEGEVLIDGVNIKKYKLHAIHDMIGYISQKAILFSGTIKSNVAFGDNGKQKVLDSDVVDAIYTAQAADFVENLPNGYDNYVAQGGSNYSGGQKQRISIARAISRRPEILIFDDSFSALDYKTDRKLRQALNDYCQDTTRLIVAQRIGTIRDADKIIVLDDGKMAGIGSHDELMKNCKVYQQIAYSQLSKEELANA
ncbi:ABC transporter ATP-binding protein [Thomasclavelia sp.]|uniref:ABC transporter ATP-binding protein n=1 Tax=Thomasclavelia sp. TaxID=3025757 RepID=UPI0025DFE7CA|nr:ABC transporter ATP-binding protein [Thomasclavelia sp.]